MSKKKIALGILSSVLMLGSMGTMLYFGIKGGKSPYDIAVENGFTGSQEDWLASLQGQNGTNGLDGQNGRDGVNGYEEEVKLFYASVYAIVPLISDFSAETMNFFN